MLATKYIKFMPKCQFSVIPSASSRFFSDLKDRKKALEEQYFSKEERTFISLLFLAGSQKNS